MQYSLQKAHFLRDVVSSGVTDLVGLRKVYPLGWDVPNEKLEKWLRVLFRNPNFDSIGMRPQYRLVNHFMLGADPEFVFTTEDNEYYHAENLALKAGRAYGADTNGRLVEIRPAPNRSALAVVGSTLATMRWMMLTAPKTQELEWKCGAYIFRDGIGGHVHLGRKKGRTAHTQFARERNVNIKPADIAGLDTLCAMLETINVYPAEQCASRRRGDNFGQLYGQFGDIRLQNHGYEYRTFPSWLDSPWLAFFTLTLSKLVTHDPKLLGKMPNTAPEIKQRIRNLLAYYKGIDDDARICYGALIRAGFPRHVGGDFRARWGLTGYAGQNLSKTVRYVPSKIEPNHRELEELFFHLALQAPLRSGVIPEPTWAPVAPPKGYYLALDQVVTHHVKGIGEMIADMCMHESKVISIAAMQERGGEEAMSITAGLKQMIHPDGLATLRKLLDAQVRVENGRTPIIRVGISWREGKRAELVKRALLSGVFPIWEVKDTGADALEAWELSRKAAPTVRPKQLGKELFTLGN